MFIKVYIYHIFKFCSTYLPFVNSVIVTCLHGDMLGGFTETHVRHQLGLGVLHNSALRSWGFIFIIHSIFSLSTDGNEIMYRLECLFANKINLETILNRKLALSEIRFVRNVRNYYGKNCRDLVKYNLFNGVLVGISCKSYVTMT